MISNSRFWGSNRENDEKGIDIVESRFDITQYAR